MVKRSTLQIAHTKLHGTSLNAYIVGLQVYLFVLYRIAIDSVNLATIVIANKNKHTHTHIYTQNSIWRQHIETSGFKAIYLALDKRNMIVNIMCFWISAKLWNGQIAFGKIKNARFYPAIDSLHDINRY